MRHETTPWVRVLGGSLGRPLLPLGLLLLAVLVAAPARAEGRAVERSALAFTPTAETVARAARPATTQRRSTLHPWDRKRVKFTVAAYGWLPDTSGDAFVDGVSIPIDISFEDLLDKVKGGFMGYAMVGVGRWTFAIDAFVAQLEGDATGDLLGVTFNTKIDQTLLDFRVGYRFWEHCLGHSRWKGCCARRTMSARALIGARYWSQSGEFSVAPRRLPALRLSQSSSDEWVDPYVGAAFRADLSKRWHFSFYGDVGGFDIGEASKLTWQVQTGFGYRFSRQFYAFLGYRVLGLDRTTGSGRSKNGSDIRLHGPMLGAGFLF